MEVTMEVTMETMEVRMETMEETVVEETSFVEDMAVADETFLNLGVRKKCNLMNLQRGRHQKNKKQPPITEDVTVDEIEMDIDMDGTSLNLKNNSMNNLQRGRHQKNKKPHKSFIGNKVRDQMRAEAREKKKTDEAERRKEKEKEKEKKRLRGRKIQRLDKKEKAKLRKYCNYSSTI